jgi:cephalosporin hydroxylase
MSSIKKMIVKIAALLQVLCLAAASPSPSTLPKSLPTAQPGAIAFTIEITTPNLDEQTVIPGTIMTDYRLSTTSLHGIIGLVAISIDRRIIAFQSTQQCLNHNGTCWLRLSRYDLAIMSGRRVLSIQVLEGTFPYSPISFAATRTYVAQRQQLALSVSDAYMKWWHEEAAVWTTIKWLGVATQKLPADMWNYQELITSLQPSIVIETGTRIGGSALFFATVLQSLTPKSPLQRVCSSNEQGQGNVNDLCSSSFVLTIDISHVDVHAKVKQHPGIELLEGSSVSASTKARLNVLLNHPTLPRSISSKAFVVLDSDHSKAHVLAELELFAEVLQLGDYVVVEDGIVNGHPVESEWGPGPWEAVEAFETKYGEDVYFLHDYDREHKMGVTAAPKGFLIRTSMEFPVE